MNYLANVTRPSGDPQVLRQGASSLSGIDQLGRALGWFGIALGVMEMMAPRNTARSLGLRQPSLVRAYGAREIGAGILTLSVDKGVGLWARVAGDALDIATLLPALRQDGRRRRRASRALVLVMGVTLLDLLAANIHAARHGRRSDARRYDDRSGFPKGRQSARGVAAAH